MTVKRQKVTKGREKISQREQLVQGYPRYTRDTFCSKLNPYLTDNISPRNRHYKSYTSIRSKIS